MKRDYANVMSGLSGKTGLWLSQAERQKKVVINEIPIMISEDGRLICLPRESDMPVIGICALPRTGKTWIAHGMLDRMHWNWKMPISILNDSLDETNGWDFENKKYANQLKAFLEVPKPLPLVHLYPNTKTLHPLNLQRKNKAIIKIGIPLKEVIRNCHLWFDFGKTEHYFRNIINELLDVKNKEELFGRISEKIERQEMRYKLINYLNEFFDEGIVKIGKDRDIVTEIDVIPPEKKSMNMLIRWKYNPFSALMRLNMIPSLHTYDLLIKPYCPSVLRYYLEDIYQTQFRDQYFKNKEIFLYMDEILRISSTMNKTVASGALEKILTRTGMARIGFMYASQSYLKLDPFVQRTTRYLFALRFNTEKEARAIANDFNLPESMKDRILRLDKFQFMAMTNERFISYDSDGNREIERDAVVGSALPPLSKHLLPKT